MNEARTPFVLFTTQRNGSTWLMSVLNGFESVAAHDELFLDRRRSPHRRWDSAFAYPRYVEANGGSGSRRPLSVFRYLDAFYGQPGTVGFKLMYSQVKAFPEILPYLARRRVRAVHLVRRNHLDVLISFAIKRRIGQAHILATDERPTDIAVELDTASLLKDLRRLQRKHEVGRLVLRASGLRHMEVAYEELVGDPARFADVLDFLEISRPATMPAATIVKTRQGTQRDALANYHDVRKVLRESEFAALLD